MQSACMKYRASISTNCKCKTSKKLSLWISIRTGKSSIAIYSWHLTTLINFVKVALNIKATFLCKTWRCKSWRQGVLWCKQNVDYFSKIFPMLSKGSKKLKAWQNSPHLDSWVERVSQVTFSLSLRKVWWVAPRRTTQVAFKKTALWCLPSKIWIRRLSKRCGKFRLICSLLQRQLLLSKEMKRVR